MSGNAVIGALRATLGIDSAQFEAGLKRSQGQLAGFGKMAGIGFAAAGAAAVAMAGAVAAGVGQALKDADDLGKLSQKVGVAVEELSRLKYAAELSDVSMEGLGTGLKLLSKNLAATAGGAGGAAAGAFQALGVSVKDASGALRPTSAVIEDIAGKFGGMEDGAGKTALALALFGKSGSDLIPLLNSGKEGLKAMSDEADRLGIVIDEQTAASAEQFNDNLTRLGKVMGGVTTRVAAGLAPTLANLSGVLVKVTQNQSLMAGVSKTLEFCLKGLVSAGVITGAVFSVLGTSISTTAAAVMKTAKGDFSGAWDTLKSGARDMLATVKVAAGAAVDVWTGTGTALTATAPKVGDQIAAPIVQGEKKVKKATEKVKDAADELRKEIEDLNKRWADLMGQGNPKLAEFDRNMELLRERLKKNLVNPEDFNAWVDAWNIAMRDIKAPKVFDGELKAAPTLQLDDVGADDRKRLGEDIAWFFADGVEGALHGDLGRTLQGAFGSIANKSFGKAFKGLGESLSKSLGDSLGGVFKSDGLGGGLANLGLGIGLSLLGGLFGGGDKVIGKVALSAEDRRALQGVGTVLGSVKAQSQSISNSLTDAEKYQNKDLDFASAQVAYLRAIQEGIASLTGSLGRDIGVGGALDTSKLGLGKKGKTETTLVDQGIDLGSGTVADYIMGRFGGSYYQNTQSVKTKKGFLGIGAGTVTTNREYTSDLGDDVTASVGRVMSEVYDGVIGALGILGADAGQALLDKVVDIGRVSLEGMSASEITEQLGAVFSKVGDQVAAEAMPALSAFQKAGEGAYETLQRLATDYTTIDATLTSIGMTFASVGVSSLEARERLIELSGSLDEFASQTDYFKQNFLSAAEQLEPVQKAVTAEMNRLGVGAVTTKAQFADLVQGLDVSTEEGAKLYAALMDVAPAFAKVADAAQETVDSARAAAVESLEAEKSRLEALRDEWKGWASSLTDYAEGLYQSTGGDTSLARLSAMFDEVAAGVANGDKAAYETFTDVADRFKSAFDARSSSALEQKRNDAKIRIAAEKGAKTATQQASIAEQQLFGINATISAIGGVEDAVLSVGESLRLLADALLGQNGGTSDGRAWGASPGVNTLLADATGYTGDFGSGGFQAYIVGASEEQKAAARQILTAFGQENRIVGFATGGTAQLGGTGGIDSSLAQIRMTPGEWLSVSHEDPLAAYQAGMAGMGDHLSTIASATVQSAIGINKLARHGTGQGFAVRSVDPAQPIDVKVIP